MLYCFYTGKKEHSTVFGYTLQRWTFIITSFSDYLIKLNKLINFIQSKYSYIYNKLVKLFLFLKYYDNFCRNVK